MKRKRGTAAPRTSSALIALICLAVGAAAGWGARGIDLNSRPVGLPKITRPAEAESELADMTPSELRDEVRRLRQESDAKDRQIAELTIQLTIATKGSKPNQN